MKEWIDFPVIAHRGASAYAPENTMAAFDLAYVSGTQWVEFDVMLSQDGEPFVIHDDTLNRTTNGRGKVCETSAKSLQSLDAGSWFSKQYCGEKIPHFLDVLKWLIFSNMQANIEIKPAPGFEEQTAVVVMSYLQRYWPIYESFPLISSFSEEVLSICQSLVPEMPIGLLIHEWDGSWQQKAEMLNCFSLHVNHRILNQDRVKQIKKAGFRLLSYTVNRRQLAEKLIHWGVDAVFSDYPDLLIK